MSKKNEKVKKSKEEMPKTKENDAQAQHQQTSEIEPQKTESQREVVDVEQSKEYKELEDKYLRLAAEFENYKKRSARELSRLLDTAGDDLMLSLLDIVDDFQRALKLEHSNLKAFQKGTEMIYNKLQKLLSRRGLREIKAMGEIFDPTYHEAVMQKEEEEGQDGLIIEELQKGYFLNSRVLRPSKVVVVKRKTRPDDAPGGDEKDGG